MNASDLTSKEQANVRAALRFLRARCGGWVPLGKALGIKDTTASSVAGRGTVTASVAFRVARLAGVGVDGLLAGAFPPAGACPHCGHIKEDDAPIAAQ